MFMLPHSGLVNSFLSQKFWAPLARLTFGAYLIHPILIFIALMTRPVMFHATYVEIVSMTAILIISMNESFTTWSLKLPDTYIIN